MKQRILIVDDDRALCETMELGLRKRELEVAWRTDAAGALGALEAEDFAVVVADVCMPGMNGVDLCARIVASRPDTPVIVMTAFGSLEAAVGAIRAGAYDFLPKPFNVETLALALDRALRHRALSAELKRLRKAVGGASGPAGMVGASPAMQRVYALLDRLADADATALVTGESGTGKELVARALHARSRRAGGPFVAVSCAAVPEPLLESELFGHVKGAFTGAHETRPGLFVQAGGGTLFLDEIAETPPGIQVKLLRAVQERAARPLGGDAEVPFDVRIVAASNRDLEGEVAERRFREDLFYRLNVVRIEVPPLRARGGDVLLLAQHFVDRAAARTGKPVRGLTHAAGERLLAYGWPGNVRELESCIERAVALAQFDEVTLDDLPEKIRQFRPRTIVLSGDDPAELVPLEEVERRYILRVLEAVGGNKTVAARVLGLDRRTLYRKLERWGAAAGSGAEGG